MKRTAILGKILATTLFSFLLASNIYAGKRLGSDFNCRGRSSNTGSGRYIGNLPDV